jgi:hypothetical protein
MKKDKGKGFWASTPLCSKHKQLLNLSYIRFFEDAERREKKGMKQEQCPICKRWLWKDEM